MTISHMSLRALGLIPWDDWTGRDTFRLGDYQYRVTGFDNEAHALTIDTIVEKEDG